MWTEKDNKVLKKLQVGIPINLEPFKVISEDAGIPEDEVLDVTRHLKEGKIIRRISPIYDTRMLGYESALVAFEVDPDLIEEKAEIVSAHPGVSHNYQRNSELNMWFTLAVPPDSELGLKRSVETLAEITGAKRHVIFRTKKLFKIGVKLDFKGASLEKEEVQKIDNTYSPLTEEEKGIIRITQRDIEITHRPFASSAEELGLDEETVVEHLRDFQQRGVMRRFAAILNHRKAGYSANGMLVTWLPEDIIEETGNKIASFKAVSHCYHRTSEPQWKYNFFSMIHGMSKEEVEGVISEIVKEAGLKDYEILYSSREFKKRRVRYFTEELHNWENQHALTR